MISVDDVERAARTIAGRVHRTPLLRSGTLSEQLGVDARFKAELFQRTGSFKVRGALNRTDFSIHSGDIDLAEIAEDAVRRYEQQAAAFGLTIEAVTDGPAPAVADADRVLQIVSNLVENALRLGGDVRVVSEPGLLRVEDNGPGLQPDELDRAFERFYLHERYGRERPVGTGLGLAIVKELTAAMGGSVEVTSEPGRLTRFTVRLAAPARVVSRA